MARRKRPGRLPARAAGPAVRPRAPSDPARPEPALGRAGRRAALAIAGTGLFWIAATAIGAAAGWPMRTRALCDLIALAGFGWALYLTYQAWRIGRVTRG